MTVACGGAGVGDSALTTDVAPGDDTANGTSANNVGTNDTAPDDTGDADDTGDGTLDGDGDGASASVDCDDADPSAWPGAPELCDGIQNDCDSNWFGDVGVATLWGLDGAAVDLTSALTGVDGAPAEAVLDQPGALSICPGTWYVNLTLDADVQIEGAGVDETTLHGGGAGTVVSVLAPGLSVELADLSIVGGQASNSASVWGSSRVFAGGLFCGDASIVALRDLLITGNSSSWGAGGIGLSGACEATAERVDLVANAAGNGAGGVATNGASLRFSDGLVAENTSSGDNGGLWIYGGYVYMSGVTVRDNYCPDDGGGMNISIDSEGDLEDVRFEDNEAGDIAGGLLIYHATRAALVDVSFERNRTLSGGGLMVAGTDEVYLTDVSFADNVAEIEGGGVWFGTHYMEANSCDFSGDSPESVYAAQAGVAYDFGEDESFKCTGGGCSPL